MGGEGERAPVVEVGQAARRGGSSRDNVHDHNAPSDGREGEDCRCELHIDALMIDSVVVVILVIKRRMNLYVVRMSCERVRARASDRGKDAACIATVMCKML